jgi:soluble lytic murein transglycosylase-like protein
MNVKIPSIQDTFYNAAEATQVRRALLSINTRFGSIIKNVSQLTKVPEVLITSFIFIESGGNDKVPSTGVERATGLMQISPATVYDTINIEIRRKRLLAGEAQIINKHIPNFRNVVRRPYSEIKQSIIKSLQNNEFNILLGTMYLGQLIDLNKKGNDLRLDKVVVQYNQVRYSAITKSINWKTLSKQELYKTLNSITQSYVVKLIGINGTLDLLV